MEGARPEIWSYGHRNPQGLAIDAARASSGPTSMGRKAATSSISFSAAGTTAGRSQRYGVDYSGRPIAINSEEPGTELPIRYWVPFSIAPSSLSVETLPSETEIWIGALAGEMVVQLTLNDDCVLTEERLFRNQLGRIRDVRVDDSGVLYILTDGEDGKLYRVERPHVSEDDKTHL